MADEKDIIDFGSWTVPTSWSELNLKTYQEIEQYYEDKEEAVDIRKIIHILCNKTVDEVNQLPSDFLDIILEKLAFLQKTPEVKEPTNKFVIDGITYQVNIMEKLKTGEWVALDTIIKNDKHNYAAMLAVLCRKENEAYDSKFEAEVFNDRVKMWENQPLLEVLRVVNFFLSLWLVLRKHSELYMAVEEAINLTAKQLKTSQRIGVCKRLSLIWQIHKCRKLLKSTSNTSQTSLPSSHISFKKVKQMKKKINSKRI